jgi:serine/threonine-protein kinase
VQERRFASGDRVGSHRLDALLGEGASGIVWRAASDDGRTVAVKLLRPARQAHAVARHRFLREARLAGEVESRHVVPILDAGEDDGLTYLVLPFYEGGSLADRIRAAGRLPLDEVVDLAAQLGRGLDAVHAREIRHRDIKPSNVLLDGHGTAALSDFGLARAEESTRLTQDGQLLGTAHYVAPELIAGEEATAASDIYALGCVYFECLTGTPPFTGRDAAEVGFGHLAEDPPDPCMLRPALTRELAAAVLTAVEKDPRRRPTTATALARLLHAGHSAAPV